MSRSGNFTFIFVMLSAITLLTAWMGMLPSEPWQLLILAILVVLVGLPHGALDPLIAREAGLIKGYSGFFRFGIVYLSQAVATLIFWLLLPFIALPAFLAMSAWHFAGDWKHALPDWLRILGGASIVLTPILFHQPEVSRLFTLLSDPATAASLVGLLKIPALLTLTAVTIALVLYRRRLGRAGLELIAIVALAWALPPLVFFTVYFCALHSPRHALEVVERYAIKPREAILVASVFTIMAVLFASVFFVSGEGGALDDKSIRILFVGLAALTVPHMILLSKADRAE